MPRIPTLIAPFIVFVPLGTSACATYADGVAGRWQGSFDIPAKEGTRHDTAYLILRVTRSQLSGSAGPNEQMQEPISQGVIRDGVLTFQVRARSGAVIEFALEDQGDHLMGIATGLPPNTEARGVVNVARVRGRSLRPRVTGQYWTSEAREP